MGHIRTALMPSKPSNRAVRGSQTCAATTLVRRVYLPHMCQQVPHPFTQYSGSRRLTVQTSEVRSFYERRAQAILGLSRLHDVLLVMHEHCAAGTIHPFTTTNTTVLFSGAFGSWDDEIFFSWVNTPPPKKYPPLQGGAASGTALCSDTIMQKDMHNSSSNAAANNRIYTIEWQEINHQRGKTASPLYDVRESQLVCRPSWLRHVA